MWYSYRHRRDRTQRRINVLFLLQPLLLLLITIRLYKQNNEKNEKGVKLERSRLKTNDRVGTYCRTINRTEEVKGTVQCRRNTCHTSIFLWPGELSRYASTDVAWHSNSLPRDSVPMPRLRRMIWGHTYARTMSNLKLESFSAKNLVWSCIEVRVGT